MSDYRLARTKLRSMLHEVYSLIATDEEEEDDFDEFQIDKQSGSIGRWVLFFETTAPVTGNGEQGVFHTYAKGLYVISDDGTGTAPMQDWEIIGMSEYCRDNEIFG